jgi:Flp pilus assembly protein TadG
MTALGMLGMIAMVALIIDGGHAWTQQRDSQNGSDATSEAGALVLMGACLGGPHRSTALSETA